MRNRVIAIAAVFVLAVGFLIARYDAGKRGEDKPPRPPIPVETARAETRKLKKSMSLFGNVHAGRAATVSAEVQGAVEMFKKEPGDVVADGEVVCRLDASNYRIGLASAESALAQAAASREKAKLGYDRTRALFRKNVSSMETMDSDRLAFDMADAQHKMRKAERDRAKLNLENASVKAPYAGRIAEKYIQKGDFVKEGDKVFDIVDMSSPYIKVFVPEKDLWRIESGAEAAIWFDAFPGRQISGVVTNISPRTALNTRGLEIRIGLDDKDGLARDGLFARIEIVSPEHDALVVPKDALVEKAGEKMVFRVRGGKAEKVNIDVLDQTGDILEITGKVENGDELVVTGNEILRDGSDVNVVLRR